MTRRGRAAWFLGLALGVGAIAVWRVPRLWGHVLPAEFVPNHTGDFDFRHPPCEVGARPDTGPQDALLRYLGVGGVWIEWRGVAVLTAPYFSRHGVLRAGFGRAGWDEGAIAAGLAGLPLERARSVLVGHAHYDHLADLPPILLGSLQTAQVYVNRSGAHVLAAFPELRPRVVELEPRAGHWFRLSDASGVELPVRVLPLVANHTDHFGGYRYAPGEVVVPWTTWEGRKLSAMRCGRVHAFLIDLLAEDGRTPVFRIHYQDTASDAPLGFPSREVVDERPIDLAIVCLPASWRARDYPAGLLAHTRARHVLVTHYEDFFRSAELHGLRFTGFLSDRRAATFFADLRQEMERPGHDPIGPAAPTCGPSGPAWTMALPGEWLRFPARSGMLAGS